MADEKKYPYYRGRPLNELTKEELIEALETQHKYYEARIASEQATANFALEIAKSRAR